MKYLFVTLDAIYKIVANRYLQSAEFEDAKKLVSILLGNSDTWEKWDLKYTTTKEGGVFFTNTINRNKGILFDYSTFNAFDLENNSIANIVVIFQKTLRYAVRYFESSPLSASEKPIPGKKTIMVYPFPFVAAKDVYKIFVDKNSTKWNRKDKNFLIAYASGTAIDVDKVTISQTNLNKAVEALSSITITPKRDSYAVDDSATPMAITELSEVSLSLDGSLRYDDWLSYLTSSQSKFVLSEVSGPERLEGAAGTGKTLSMLLRAVQLLKTSIAKNVEYHIIFITHSLSTQKHITEIFLSLYPQGNDLISSNLNEYKNTINITTLQDWCIEYLGRDIKETEYEKDVQDAKVYQLLIIEQVWSDIRDVFLKTYKPLCSPEFANFIETTPHNALMEMLQYEISIIIKGRAGGSIERYKQLIRSQYAIPCKKEGDLAFLFLIFGRYQGHLEKTGEYDSDDIVLSTLGNIDTPIKNRRRSQEGYSVCFIDETHMFNLNELSVFPYLNKTEYQHNIIYAIDKSQAVGDRDMPKETMTEAMQTNEGNIQEQKFETLFRSCPDIVNLAFNVLSSGATLFRNFENPLEKTTSNFTSEEEKKCLFPQYIAIEGDEKMIAEVFKHADKLHKDQGLKKSQILIIVTEDLLLRQIEKYAIKNNKPIEVLKTRGDSSAIHEAGRHNSYVMGGIDHVGGLEFDAEIIVGVDKNRVPPNVSGAHADSYHFMNYAWHNRLYVAITRAKYALILLGDKARGSSDIFDSARYLNLVESLNWDD